MTGDGEGPTVATDPDLMSEARAVLADASVSWRDIDAVPDDVVIREVGELHDGGWAAFVRAVDPGPTA